ncbi:MAG: 23S rRNA (guanosine(2251)-2'-O)-methyltransferase RlmB, partial [Oscillospiraceae bacterium]|nr:23S rRNA (guanosine(2251)-2'-O)-methyltransferase RlmB [Oscillospiraceae bacterium]
MAFETEREDLIEGRNAVIEALRAGRSIDKIYLAKGETDRTLGHIASKARAQGVVVVETDRRKLDALSATKAHQGVVAVAAVKDYCTVADILRAAEEKGEPPFVIVCDEISDPQNLGAVLRSAECVGAHGVIIPKRRSAGITGVVEKVSAGAAEYVPVARVPNLSAALRELKEHGLWVYGSAAGAERSLWETDFIGPVCLVIGSEGDGMGRVGADNCYFLVG